MESPLTHEERAAVLAAAGLAPEAVTEPVVVEHVTHTPKRKARKADEPTTVEEFVAEILAKSHGRKETAFTLVRKHREDEFDRLKLSKIQAAAQGLTPEQKSEHNRALYAHLRKTEDDMNTLVRKHFRDNGGFVKAKVTRAKTTNPELDAFLLKHADNDVLQQALALIQAQA
jgi:arylamine N-acetyltransferase